VRVELSEGVINDPDPALLHPPSIDEYERQVTRDTRARHRRPNSAGNNAASVMGRTYPGPGSTIGPADVFGTRAARHMARNQH
jgi:3-oxosteroid 1-dehydrogenase